MLTDLSTVSKIVSPLTNYSPSSFSFDFIYPSIQFAPLLSHQTSLLLSLSLSLSIIFLFLKRMHFSLFILSLLLYLPLPALADPLYKLCGGTTTFSENSTYQANINLLFSSLAANSTSTGFADGTVGTVPNRVSGLVLCRGDVNNSSCSSCLSIASQVHIIIFTTVIFIYCMFTNYLCNFLL